MTPEIKPGDWVKCVKNDASDLVLGKRYKVTEIYQGRVVLEGEEFAQMGFSRFVKCDPPESEGMKDSHSLIAINIADEIEKRLCLTNYAPHPHLQTPREIVMAIVEEQLTKFNR